MRYPLGAVLCCLLLGASMPLFAGKAHPKGPEGRPFTEHSMTFRGDGKNCVLTLSYPKPDDIGDRVHGSYQVDGFDSPFALFYNYRGHFWQGEFGSLAIGLYIIPRPAKSPPWKDIDSLLKGIQMKRTSDNKETSGNSPEARQEWMEPFLSQINGIPCVQQYVYRGFDPKGEWLYIFPIDENHALEISFHFIRNRIPGQPDKSDWRPRAEELAKRILATVKVHGEKTAPPKKAPERPGVVREG